MTRTEQSEFIASLCGAVARDLQSKVDSGAIPEDWDGHELRALLAEKFSAEAARTLARGGALSPRSKRLREYRSAIYCSNI